MIKRISKILSITVALAMLTVGVMVWASPAGATNSTQNSATLSNAGQAATSNATISFTASTSKQATAIKSITVNFPNFTVPASPTVDGISASIGGNGNLSSASAAGTLLTVTLTSATAPGASAVSFTVHGLTNPAAAGNQSITITSKDGSAATIDSGNPLAAIIANANVGVTATVSQALTASIASASVNLTVDPSATAFQVSSGYALSVATNAKNGVTTSVKISGALTGTAYSTATIAAETGTFASPTSNVGKPTANHWGINVDGTSNVWAGPTTSGESISGLSSSGPTNALTQTHAVGVNVNYLTPADQYTTTIYYTITPNF